MDLLCRGMYSRNTKRRLMARGLRVEVTSWSESGHGDDKVQIYAVTHDVIVELRSMHAVEGQPHWGYTDHDELHMSDIGVSAFYDRIRALEEGASHAMVPTWKWLDEVSPEPWVGAV